VICYGGNVPGLRPGIAPGQRRGQHPRKIPSFLQVNREHIAPTELAPNTTQAAFAEDHYMVGLNGDLHLSWDGDHFE
jgi:hypothetical protein